MYNKGDTVHFNCSSCRKPLCDIIITNTDGDTYNYMATCPYCGDKSFKIEIKGLTVMGGIGEFNENSPTCDDFKSYTIIENVTHEDNFVTLHIKKVD